MRKFFTSLIFLILFSSIIHAEEYIDTYHVDITILDNGNISVTENIKVWAEGKDIKRGIYRWFPLSNTEKYQLSMPYNITDVTRNGKTEKIGKKIIKARDRAVYYFGDRNKFIEPNTFHEYAISYEVDRATLQFAESDQLYWNIIPFYWPFPIKNLSATVKFPISAAYLGVEIFSGGFYDKKINNLNVTHVVSEDNITFQGSNFGIRQGLRARIKFEPDLIPSYKRRTTLERSMARLNHWIDKNLWFVRSIIWLVLNIALTYSIIQTAYFLRRNQRGMPTIIPQFYPPQNISPLAARFILRQGNVDGTRMVTIALVSLISKGLLEVSEEKIERLDKDAHAASRGEVYLLNEMHLTKAGDVFEIKQEDEEWSKNLRRIKHELIKFAKKEFQDNVDRALLAQILFYLLAISSLVGGAISFAWASPFLGLGSLILLFINFTCTIPDLKNYTQFGRKNMSLLLGLKMYIKAAELQSLSNEPKPTSKNFSDIYPYAFAMGLNTVWAEKFASQLANWQILKSEGLSWYVGGGTDHSDNNFESHLSSFENSFSAAANYSPPSESSGGGGGGGSGGGGGGGGGGW